MNCQLNKINIILNTIASFFLEPIITLSKWMKIKIDELMFK